MTTCQLKGMSPSLTHLGSKENILGGWLIQRLFLQLQLPSTHWNQSDSLLPLTNALVFTSPEPSKSLDNILPDDVHEVKGE